MSSDTRGARETGTPTVPDDLAAQARRLRDEGMSRPAIQRALGLTAWQLTKLFDREKPIESLRTQAKDAARETARALRLQGASYNEIREHVQVSKSTLSLWLRDLPTEALDPDKVAPRRARAAERQQAGRRETFRKKRVPLDQEIEDAAAEIGPLSDREILIAGAIAYWCEGAKARPKNSVTVHFSNNDPGLIALFLRFLSVCDISADRIGFRLQIHKDAQLERAYSFWSDAVGVSHADFLPTTFKTGNPETRRKNVGTGYTGCMSVRVLRSSELYRKIEGSAKGVMGAIPDEWRHESDLLYPDRADVKGWWYGRAARLLARRRQRLAAARSIGDLNEREIRIAGAIAYWCEGAKSKPWRRSHQMVFANSDPDMIIFFLRFLEMCGIDRDQIVVCISIHESADVPAAEKFWAEITGLPRSSFQKAAIKRHAPRTDWSGGGPGYHGCLFLRVRRGAALYRRIEGWARGVMQASRGASAPVGGLVPVDETVEPVGSESRAPTTMDAQ
ncbi:hypothetical protein [Allonocardiopsis opalescens]|uniref:Homeodomain-like domain-containing protein n=1 Tax=Allonocardiopsis opalescens TaxID=1144618 RepID=A0A2T0QCZ8_9ACTN|nr:hypothetical protein [Allonocardiopsis opalescens]PRY01826.1 hypothetical protein CLV72_101422 [Allonocardiopsis opalescens]